MFSNNNLFLFIFSLVAILLIIFLIICNCFLSYSLTRNGIKKMKKVISKSKNVPSEDTFLPFIDKNFFADHNSTRVNILSFDQLKLSAIFVANEIPSKKIVIFSHGYTASATSILCYAPYYYNKGFNILAVDNRCHGESEGKYLGMGYLDHFDILNWITKANELIGSNCEIVLHGVSMGAATVCLASNEIPSNVKCIISDCAYDCISNVFKNTIKNALKIPPAPIVKVTSLLSKIRSGYYFSAASPIKAVVNTKVPILYIHGDKDTFVPADMVYKLYNVTPEDKRDILIIKGAGHGESVAIDNKNYFNKVDAFLNKNFYTENIKNEA